MPPSSPTEPDDHTQREIRMCADMADLAYQLARATAAKAMQAEADPPPTAAATKPCPQLLFARLARIMLACMAAEKRLTGATGSPPRDAEAAGRPPSATRPPRPDIAALQRKLAALKAAPSPGKRSVIPALMREMSKHTGLSIDLAARVTAPNSLTLATPPPTCRAAA